MTRVVVGIALNAKRRLGSAMQMKPAHYWLLGPGGTVLIFILFGLGIFPGIFALVYILWLRRKARLGGWLPKSAGKGDELERMWTWARRERPVRRFLNWLIR